MQYQGKVKSSKISKKIRKYGDLPSSYCTSQHIGSSRGHSSPIQAMGVAVSEGSYWTGNMLTSSKPKLGGPTLR